MSIMPGSTNNKKIMNNNLVKVDGKVYAKSLRFGNRKQKSVFKDKSKYDRKSLKNIPFE